MATDKLNVLGWALVLLILAACAAFVWFSPAHANPFVCDDVANTCEWPRPVIAA